jgi:hypothetical protein
MTLSALARRVKAASKVLANVLGAFGVMAREKQEVCSIGG